MYVCMYVCMYAEVKYDKFIPMVSHHVCTQQYIKYAKNVSNVLNQNVNMTKLARIATFAIKIVDKLCFSRSTISGTQSKYYCRDNSSTRHTDQISWPFLTFPSVAEKNWPLSMGYFGSLGSINWNHILHLAKWKKLIYEIISITGFRCQVIKIESDMIFFVFFNFSICAKWASEIKTRGKSCNSIFSS